MPLARFHLYAQGVRVWLAPTLASGDGWIATMRHIARENRMFVVGVSPVLHADQVPAGFPGRDRLIPAGYLDDNGPWLEEGNTVVVAPSGTVLAGLVRQREETLIADLGLRDVTVARRHLEPPPLQPPGHLPAAGQHLAAACGHRVRHYRGNQPAERRQR